MTQALPVLLLGGALWFQLAIALHPWWEDGSYYDYGWLVPLLCIWCLWARWQNLAPKDRILTTSPLTRIWQVILVLAIVGLAFIRLIERRKVDFPQPDGPISAVTDFSGMSSETSNSACFSP